MARPTHRPPRQDTSIPEKDGYTPMHGAGFQGRAAIAKALIAHGLDPSDRHSAVASFQLSAP